MTDLSILIPSRNEQFLKRTVEDCLQHIKADTDVFVALDGWQTELPDDSRVKALYFPESIGQRAATNRLAELSDAKYLMKLDAHCALDDGFDVKMLEAYRQTGDNVTMVPVMRNLHAFDWVCPDGHRRYQGPSGPCTECGKPTMMDVVWIAKTNPQSCSYCFDTEPHFQYFGEYIKRVGRANKLNETMSLQGSCFMLTREKYFDLNICDEEFGSWGSQGIETAVKTWLSGGRCICNRRTWYAHMFRTQGGDFGFPYPQNTWKQAKTKAKDVFFTNSWPKQTKPLSWLIEKFAPIPGWHYEREGRAKVTFDPETTERVMKEGEKFNRAAAVQVHKPTVGFVYFSDNNLPANIRDAVQRQIKACCNGHQLVSTTLVPMDFGENKVLELERGYLTMFRQILDGIERCKSDVLFLVEHDVFYHPSHFDFMPPEKETFYYDENKWHVRHEDGHALFYHHMSTSMLCAYREVLLKHYQARVEKVEREGFTRHFGFEPGSHKPPRGCDEYGRLPYFAKFPSLDIRHDMNLTSNRWRKDQFRNQKQLWAWKEDKVWNLPGWTPEELREIVKCRIPEKN